MFCGIIRKHHNQVNSIYEMRKQIQKFIWKLFERELITLLAVSFVGLAMVFVKADSATTDLSFTILPAAGNTITVTAPNGGESWTIGTTKTITWTNTGSISDVKIELQRSTSGSWEELTASTTNDGSYPWVVTGTATAEATVRISEVGDATVNDTSNAVFSIVAASVSGGGGGFYTAPAPYQPAINEVTPRWFSNSVATEIILRGVNFKDGAIVRLDGQGLVTSYISSMEIRATVPVNFPVGSYTVYVINPDSYRGQYSIPVAVYKLTIAPPSTGGVNEVYSAKLIRQSQAKLILQPSEEATVWVEFKNTGNMSWTATGNNPVRLGVTNPQDHISLLRGSGWVSNNRSAVMRGVNTADAGVVHPGETARFMFTLEGPIRAGRYRESFLPVVEYKTWMRAKVAVFNLNVVIKKTISKTKLPSTGGITIPAPSKQAVLFVDGTEKLFSQIARGASDIWGTITKLFSWR